jgi:pyruvate formate lyase activating enzyme
MDGANVDLKGFTEKFYHEICAAYLKPVLETLEYIKHQTETWLEITTLLIPGLNDSDDELQAMTEWIVERLGPDVPLHFTAFHPDHRLLDIPRTPPETLHRARNIALRNGIRHCYTGNIHDVDGQSTDCHQCGQLLIERDWYRLGAWNLDSQGACKSCGTSCAGRFEPTPGSWGNRRQPIRIAEDRQN